MVMGVKLNKKSKKKKKKKFNIINNSKVIEITLKKNNIRFKFRQATFDKILLCYFLYDI